MPEHRARQERATRIRAACDVLPSDEHCAQPPGAVAAPVRETGRSRRAGPAPADHAAGFHLARRRSR
ncbi:hypothetical protein [Saccharopolyspora gregorii]|uniref:hypothetical protein n=1 Tax=Saccharopolyspora gregorii TaxID=33914 RepID=UPI0031ECE7F6